MKFRRIVLFNAVLLSINMFFCVAFAQQEDKNILKSYRIRDIASPDADVSLSANDLNTKKTVFSNGLTLLHREFHELDVVAIHVWVKAGSINENKKIAGISHFIEHMLFKGTQKRKVGEVSAEIENKGGRINAATSKEFTYYHIVIPGRYIDTALDVLSDCIIDASFDENELEMERKVILEEIKRKYDDPSEHVWELFNQLLYTAHPYGSSVIGTSESVKDLKRESLLEYHRKYYVPENMTVVIVGNIFTSNIADKVKKAFDWEEVKTERIDTLSYKVPMVKSPAGIKTNIIEKQVQQAYVMMGFLGPSIRSDMQYALDIACYILGRGKSSRLYKSVRQEQGLVYSVDASFLTMRGQGPITVSARCEKDDIDKVRQSIIDQINKMKKEGIEDFELEKAKMMIESEYFLDQETYQGQADNLGYYQSLDTYTFAENYLSNIFNVTIEDVNKAMEEYFKVNEYIFVAIKPEAVQ